MQNKRGGDPCVCHRQLSLGRPKRITPFFTFFTQPTLSSSLILSHSHLTHRACICLLSSSNPRLFNCLILCLGALLCLFSLSPNRWRTQTPHQSWIPYPPSLPLSVAWTDVVPLLWTALLSVPFGPCPFSLFLEHRIIRLFTSTSTVLLLHPSPHQPLFFLCLCLPFDDLGVYLCMRCLCVQGGMDEGLFLLFVWIVLGVFPFSFDCTFAIVVSLPSFHGFCCSFLSFHPSIDLFSFLGSPPFFNSRPFLSHLNIHTHPFF